MKKFAVFAFMIMLVTLLLVGCSLDRLSTENVSTDYADDMQFEDNYYVNNWMFTITDVSALHKIGKVKSTHRVKKGNDVYEIRGYPNHDFIAVEDQQSFTGYSIYGRYDGNGKPIPSIGEAKLNNVTQVHIYKDMEMTNEIKGADVSRFLALFEQRGPGNAFITEGTPQYHVVLYTTEVWGYHYSIAEKDGKFGFPMWESKLPDEIGIYFIS